MTRKERKRLAGRRQTQAISLWRSGVKVEGIAQELGVSEATVRRYLCGEDGFRPRFRKKPQNQALQERWQALLGEQIIEGLIRLFRGGITDDDGETE